jgi:hypothetical protein
LYIFSILAAPLKIIRWICNLQRRFLWEGTKKEIKWVLVTSENIFIPDKVGGLSIMDLLLVGKSLAEKNGWKWLKVGELHVLIWRAKYASNILTDEMVRVGDKHI